MAKRPSPGKCVHCLKEFKILTWDHVLPDAWYPNTKNNLEKWKVPSCEMCNKELGKVEEELLTKLGLALDPRETRSSGIPDKVLGSLNPLNGKNERDRILRKKKREKVLKNIQFSTMLPENGILPNFGPLPNLEYKVYPSVFIDPNDLTKFAEKIVRGIVYIADKSFIGEEYEIQVYVLDDNKATVIRNLVNENGEIFSREPGFRVTRSLVENDAVGGIYFIEIWGRLRFYVLVFPKKLRESVIVS